MFYIGGTIKVKTTQKNSDLPLNGTGPIAGQVVKCYLFWDVSLLAMIRSTPRYPALAGSDRKSFLVKPAG
jgi:hypothetical protein